MDATREAESYDSLRVPLWQAVLFVLAAGVLAQIAGALASGVARTWLEGHGRSADALSPFVIVPAMLASSLSLLVVAFSVPRFAGLPWSVALGLRPAAPACFIAAAIGTVMLGPTADLAMRAMHDFLPKWSLGVVPMLHALVREIPWPLAWPAFALLPGLAEELIFRGLLQNAARGRFAIAISALGFALFHLDPQHIAGVLPIGLFLAWVASRSGTRVTIVAHVANNTAAIAAVHSETFDVGVGTNEEMPWPWLPASLFVVAVCSWVIAQRTDKGASDRILV